MLQYPSGYPVHISLVPMWDGYRSKDALDGQLNVYTELLSVED